MAIQYREFYAGSQESALQKCLDINHRPLFAPEIAEARLKGDLSFNKSYTSISVKVTGRTNRGEHVVLYIHEQNPFSTPEGIIEAKRKRIINGAGIFPQDSFDKFVEKAAAQVGKEKRTVWHIDQRVLADSIFREIDVPNTQIIPFLGSREFTERYLAAHRKAYCIPGIGVWYHDDLADEPLARLLCFGNNDTISLYDSDYRGRGACFVGVREEQFKSK